MCYISISLFVSISIGGQTGKYIIKLFLQGKSRTLLSSSATIYNWTKTDERR